jgi:hypothetical protein
MRALSLKQPYAHAVLNCGKTIENRRWRPVDPELLEELRRGFLIHAAKGMTRDYYAEAEVFIAHALDLDAFGAEAIAARAEFRRDFEARARFGGIVGRARLVDIIPPNKRRGLAADAIGTYPAGVYPRWHMREQWGFVLADVTTLPFTPLKGGLGFFHVSKDVTASLEESQ